MSENVHSKVNTEFKSILIKEIFKSQFANSKTKVTDETVDLMGKLMKIMVVETALRAAKHAVTESKSSVSLDHVEIVLPQIMLDFP